MEIKRDSILVLPSDEHQYQWRSMDLMFSRRRRMLHQLEPSTISEALTPVMLI